MRDAALELERKARDAALEQERKALDAALEREREERLLLEQRMHRQLDTPTSTSEVGGAVLQRAKLDSLAHFLPSLPPSARLEVGDLPAGVSPSLHAAGAVASDRIAEADEDADEHANEDAKSSAAPTSASASIALSAAAAAAAGKRFRSNNEEAVQQSYNALFPHLLRTLPSALHFHDTHLRGFLTAPPAKIDVTFTATPVLSWPNVVTLVELKASLRPSDAYAEAVGQVVQRCYNLFDKQEQRQRVVAAVMDGTRIDVLLVEKHAPLKVTHTGLQPFALDSSSVGWQLLLRLLCAPVSAHGFVPPTVPAPFKVTLLQLGSARSSAPRPKLVSDFEVLRIGSPRVSAVYRAKCAGFAEAVVVKLAPAGAEQAAHEADALLGLQACPRVPRLLASGTLADGQDYVVMAPYGQHLPLKPDDAGVLLVCTTMMHVCEAMLFAYEQGERLLHRDISYGNIVHSGGAGFLIDWHVAFPEQESPFADRITGTPLFSSHRLHLPNHTHRLLDDLESVLYVLIYVAADGWLPWKRTAHRDMDALKRWHMTVPECVADWTQRCTEQLRPIIEQLRRVLFSSADTPAASVASDSALPQPAPVIVDVQVVRQFAALLQSAIS